MATLSFTAARERILAEVQIPANIPTETVWLNSAAGRVNATDVFADRDLPPTARSLRDGFAVRSQDLPGQLAIVGEVRAGQMPTQPVLAGQALAIMTGAVVPEGADQIVMKEHAAREGERLRTERSPQAGEWISRAGEIARASSVVLAQGQRMDSSAIAILATVGLSQVRVFRRPIVRILATGDEIVDIARKPNATEMRNSNSWSLAADVRRFGGEPEILPIAPDDEPITRDLIEYGLQADLLLISGGVSAGDYDFVEAALANLGAEFHFDRVLIQPGQPTVFGKARGTYFFGLPGNPLSTMVTFRLFAAAALARLAGDSEDPLVFHTARLAAPYQHKPGLTRFLPGRITHQGRQVEILPWFGSSDIPALVRANCFVIVDSEQAAWKAGDPIEVLVK
jgi:molybdopterin molybdotransferase